MLCSSAGRSRVGCSHDSPQDHYPRRVAHGFDHQLLALWAAACAEHVLPLFESVATDIRPRRARRPSWRPATFGSTWCRRAGRLRSVSPRFPARIPPNLSISSTKSRGCRANVLVRSAHNNLGGTMNKDQPIDGGSNRNVQLLLSALTVGLGVILLVYMVIVEDEPGALPLLLIALGGGWHLTTRTRLRSHHK